MDTVYLIVLQAPQPALHPAATSDVMETTAPQTPTATAITAQVVTASVEVTAAEAATQEVLAQAAVAAVARSPSREEAGSSDLSFLLPFLSLK